MRERAISPLMRSPSFRVLKSYPDLATELDEATTRLTAEREKMQLARWRRPD